MANNTVELSVDGEAFDIFRGDYDRAMQRLVKKMMEKGITVGDMSAKTRITLERDGDSIKPKFEHKIGSALQIKSEASSEYMGDVEIVEDEETGKIILRPREDPQLTLFNDEDNEPKQQEESKIIQLPGRAELPLAEAEVDEIEPEEPDYIEAEYREIEEDESILANSDEMEIKRISQAKADEITSSLEPLGLFYYIKGGRYIGIDNRTRVAYTDDFLTLDECKEWLTRVI